jgi:hypothetical protein
MITTFCLVTVGILTGLKFRTSLMYLACLLTLCFWLVRWVVLWNFGLRDLLDVYWSQAVLQGGYVIGAGFSYALEGYFGGKLPVGPFSVQPASGPDQEC